MKFIKAVIENLKARFPDNELVEASNIFDPKSLPTSDTDRMGERELELLTGHYSTFVDSSLCSDTLKECMYSSYRDYTLHIKMLLGPEHLDQLVCLRLNASKPDNFPFNLAYKHWIEAKHRRNVISKPCEKIDIEDSDTDSSGDSGEEA